MSIHAHISRESRDCDSLYEWSWIVVDSVWGDELLDFSCAMWADYAPPLHLYRDAPEITITSTAHGFAWSAPTEEGFTATEVRWCEDDSCDLEESTCRDHTAEAAGY